ncbi:MAG: hypothetical protein ACXABY_22605 [Candidatus Thorarchaeota archaeon]|jgi:hypothetical protein
MADEINTVSIGYADNAELSELLSDVKPGEEIEYPVKMRVRRNNNGVLMADVSEIVLPSGTAEEVTAEPEDEEGGSVAIVLSGEEENVAEGEEEPV